MEEEQEIMQNIDINQFNIVSGLDDNDYVVVSGQDGISGRVQVALLKTLFTSVISPNIKDGIWYVGEKNLNVEAEGKTPEFRKGSLGIEYKYTTESSSSWKLLVPYTDIKLQFDSLTDAQKDEIIKGVSEQVKEEVIDDVNEAAESATKAAESANKAAAEANKYAGRVVDITEEEWEELEKNGTWKEGIEYNVYEV